MEAHPLNDGIYLLSGAVNMGLVETAEGLVAVDTGLDKQSAKRIVRASQEIGLPIISVVNTHAHADHFGGNAYLLMKNPNLQVLAPIDESAVIRRPHFEPEYLWQGAAPVTGLRNKFVLAEPSPVHREFAPDEAWEIGGRLFEAISLPGHAQGQCGILVGDVVFAADSYFGRTVTDKHGLPFMVNLQDTLSSAKKVVQVKASWFVPGHGDATTDATADATYLCERHTLALEKVRAHLSDAPTLEVLTARMCESFELRPQNVGAWALIRTTVAAYVTALVDEGTADLEVVDGYLKIRQQV